MIAKNLLEILDNMMAGFQIIDQNWRYIYVNDAVAKHGHSTKEKLLGKTMMEVYPGIEKTEMFSVLSRCMKNRVAAHMENEFTYPNGEKGWFELSIQPVSEGILIVSIDVTERKKAEEKLKQSEERYRTLFENTGTAMCIIEEDKTFSLVNREFEKLLGYSNEELKGKKWTKFVTEEYLERMKKYHEARRKKGQTAPMQYPFDFVNKNGQLKNAMLTIDLIPGTKKSVASIIDITEREKAEDALRESEEKYRKQFEKSLDAIFLADAETGILVDCNPAATKLVGRKKSELIGKHQRILHPPETIEREFTRNFEKHRKGNGVQVAEDQIITKNGEIRDVIINATSFELEGKQFLQGTFRDITEQKKAEEKIRDLAKFHSENPDPVCRITKDGTILYANRTAEAIKCEMKQKKKPIPKKLKQTIVRALDSGLANKVEVQITDRVLSFVVAPIPDAGYVNIYGRDVTERKKAEEALMESERKLREAQEMAHIGNWWWDVKTGEVKWSEEVYRIFKLNPEKFTPQIDSIMALSAQWPEDSKRNEELIQRATKDHTQGSYEQRFLRPDKSVGYYFSTFQGKYDESGKLVAIVGTVQDITERKQTQKKLEESLFKLDLILSSLDEGVDIVSSDYIIQFQNKFLKDRFGDAVGKKCYKTYLNIDEPCSECSMEKAIKENRSVRIEKVDKNGRVFEIYSMPFKQIEGEISALEVITDITEKKKAEEMLRKSEEKYRTLTENLSIGIYRNTGPTGKILAANPALVKMLGYDNEKELLAMNSTDFYVNPEDRKKFIEKLSKYGFVQNEEQHLKRKDGTPFWASITTVVVPNEKGEIPYYDGTIEDITERKMMRKQIKDYTEKLESLVKKRTRKLQVREATLRKQNTRLKRLDEMKSRFISTVTHELRTPLVSIKGYTEFIRSGGAGKVPKKIDDMLKVVERNTDRLSKLTDDLLDQQRIESGRLEINPEPLKLQEILDATIQEFQPFIYEKNQILKVHIPANLPTVNADRIRISQVIHNFLNNASKFTPDRGRISIKAREKGKMVEVQVSDNGIGIAKKDLHKLFKPFPDIQKQSFYGGSGRGLSICKGIIDLHGGKVWAESKGKNRGTTFAFTVPTRGETE